jgi:hypothetical protein
MGELFDAVLDVTLVYPGGPAQFWAMCCGEHVRVVVDVRSRPVDTSLLSGDYENNREYRRDFHRWLTELWQTKDNRIEAMLEETRSNSRDESH